VHKERRSEDDEEMTLPEDHTLNQKNQKNQRKKTKKSDIACKENALCPQMKIFKLRCPLDSVVSNECMNVWTVRFCSIG
jgi:hypothetical protein